MVEILILWQLCQSIGNIAREKGRSATGYQFLLVAMWFGMEFLGGVVGLIATNQNGYAYLLALAGAVGGAIIAFVIAKSRPTALSSGPRGFAVQQNSGVYNPQPPQ